MKKITILSILFLLIYATESHAMLNRVAQRLKKTKHRRVRKHKNIQRYFGYTEIDYYKYKEKQQVLNNIDSKLKKIERDFKEAKFAKNISLFAIIAPFSITLISFDFPEIMLLSFPATVCFAITYTKYEDIRSLKKELERLKTVNKMLPPDQFITALPSKQKKFRDTR